MSESLQRYNPFSKEYPNRTAGLVTLLGILIGINNIFIGYKIAGVSYDRLIEIMLFFLMFKSFIRAMKESSAFRSMMLVLVIFSILRQLGDVGIWVQGSNVTFEAFLRTFVKSFTYIIFFFFVYEGLVRFPRRFLHTYMTVVFLAGLLAFFQSPVTPFTSQAWGIKLSWFGKNVQSDFHEEIQNTNVEFSDELRGIRVAGPYQYSIVYSYALLIPVALSVYLFMARRRFSYMLLFMFFALVAAMTLTRSLFLATAILLLPLIGRIKLRYYVLGALACIFLFVYFDLAGPLGILINSRLANLGSDEGAHRNLLALCGLVTVIRYPFGVPGRGYQAVRQEFYEEYGKVALRDLPSHNGFVNLGFHFTILGYLVFIFWFLLSRWHYRNIRKQVRIFFLFAFLAHMAHSSFHNSFVFIGDYNALVLLGLFTAESFWGSQAKKVANQVSA